MTQRHANQGDLFGGFEQPATKATAAPTPAPEPEPLHPVLQKISDAGIASGYNLRDGDRRFGAVLMDPKHKDRPEPWNAPSRLFQFPCSIATPKDAEPSLLIWSARNAEHPFVREIADLTGLTPRMAEGDEGWGFSQKNGLYHHAVDLIVAGRWKQLLDLRDFTDANAIHQAVDYGLDYGHLDTKAAREVLGVVGLHIPTEPTDPFHALAAVGLDEVKQDSGRSARVQNWKLGPGKLANTWGRILGIERGWFKLRGRDGKFLEWTDKAKTEQPTIASARRQPDPEPPAPPPSPPKPKREPKAKAPASPPPVIIDNPQLPLPGSFAKIEGRWHYWEANDSLSGSEYGWHLCRPYYSRAHLADTPPGMDSGKHQPKGWIKEDKRQRTVVVAGREFTCVGDEPDPVLVQVRGIPCVIDFHFGFGTHAVDRDKPFWSETGFRSFSGNAVTSAAEAITIIEAYIDAPLNPKGFRMGEGGCGGQLMAWAEFMPGGPGNGHFVNPTPLPDPAEIEVEGCRYRIEWKEEGGFDLHEVGDEQQFVGHFNECVQSADEARIIVARMADKGRREIEREEAQQPAEEVLL